MRLYQLRSDRPPRIVDASQLVPVAVPPCDPPPDLDAKVARLGKVVDRLPAVPFRRDEFAGHAVGMNLLRHINEIDPVLEHLAATGIIQRWPSNDEPMWLPVRWTNGEERCASILSSYEPRSA